MTQDLVMKEAVLYRTAFATTDNSADARAKFSTALDSFREKVKVLVAHIQADMRDYTVHDISHLDSLWEMASVIAPDLDLNPAEAFVFGGAVLLHDAGMTLAAYPNGLEDLKKEPAYSDALAYYSGADTSSGSNAAVAMATVEALRTLHAEKAKELATQRWKNPVSGNEFSLIDNAELEAHYGELIGKIAASHHWPHSKLLSEFSEELGSIAGCPIDWKINALKIALLLRCADASHIDHRRAPLMAYALRNPQGVSGEHWRFQNRLAKPHVSDAAIVYTSTKAFGPADADAWYLAFDTVRMIDGELRSADEINVRLGAKRFLVSSVRGADSPESLSQYIRVEGWRPLPVNLRVSDVTKLASTLGGSDLYNYPYAPLRELIQNSADAIEARLAVDKDFTAKDARILVTARVEDGSTILTVADNGVGMSERTLSNALLDFGSSFWRSADARQEMPGIGLALDKMRGRYGIGFFSVFMWANDVQVISRRFRDDLAATRVLEFKEGLNSRPLIRIADANDRSTRWTTQVVLRLRAEIFGSRSVPSRYELMHGRRAFQFKPDTPDFWTSVVKQIGALLPFVLEVDEGKSPVQVSIPDWKIRDGAELISSFTPMFFGEDWILRKFSPAMTEVNEGGRVIGRAFLVPSGRDAQLERSHVIAIYDKGIYVGVHGTQPTCGFVERATTNAARDRFEGFSVADDPEWVKNASIKAFGICENEAETLAVQRSLAAISSPDEGKPLFIFQRSICSYAELLERASKTKRVKIRLKQTSEDDFSLDATSSLDPLYALRLDQNRVFALIGFNGELDRYSEIMKFCAESDSLLAKLIRDLLGAVGAGGKARSELTEVEGYRNDYIDIFISGGAAASVSG